MTNNTTKSKDILNMDLNNTIVEIKVKTSKVSHFSCSVFTKFILQPSFFFFVFFRYDQ